MGKFAQRVAAMAQEPQRLAEPSAVGGMLAAAGRTLPGVSSYQAFTSPDASGAEKAGAVSGDIGGAAALLATGGVPAALKALGLGAATSAALAPAAQGIRKASGAVEEALTPPQTTSVPINMLGRTPAFLASTFTEAVPSILTALLLGKTVGALGKKPIPGAGPEPTAAPGAAVEVPPAASIPEPSALAQPTPKLSPAQIKKMGGLEQEFLGGQRLSIGQKQEFAAPGVGTAAKEFEFKMATDKAAAAVNDANSKLDAIGAKLGEIAEKQAPGVGKMGPKLAGEAIAKNYGKLLGEAGDAIESAEGALKTLPTFAKIRSEFNTKVVKELDSLADEYRLTGNRVSRVPEDVRGFFAKAKAEAKKIGSVEDLLEYRRWVRGEIEHAQKKLSGGYGSFGDALEQKIYGAVDEAISGVKMAPAERQAVNAFLEASANYKKVKFSPEAQDLRKMIGFKGRELPLDKSGEDIAKDLFKGARNLGSKMDKAQKSGLVSDVDLKRAAWSHLLDTVIGENGKLNRAALRKTVNSLDETDRQFLFGKDAGRVVQAADLADLVTYAQRYMPVTGAALPKLVPGIFGLAGKIPVAGPLIQAGTAKAYYGLPGAQRAVTPMGIERGAPMTDTQRALAGALALKSQEAGGQR